MDHLIIVAGMLLSMLALTVAALSQSEQKPAPAVKTKLDTKKSLKTQNK